MTTHDDRTTAMPIPPDDEQARGAHHMDLPPDAVQTADGMPPEPGTMWQPDGLPDDRRMPQAEGLPAPEPMPTVAPAAGDPWSGLAGDFVDDPGHVVGEARRMVRESVDALLARTEVPDGDGSSTEDLRLAFRRLRDLHRALAGL